jgi:hypothetical protein
MWTAIQYVGSGLTLVAFLVAVAAWLYKSYLNLLKKEDLIKSVPEDQRAELVERTLVLFKIDTHKLTREQQYNLALEQIRERARRFLVTAVVIVVIALIAAVLTVFAITKVNPPQAPTPTPTPIPTPTPGSLSGEIEGVEVVPGQGGMVQLFIRLSITNAGPPTAVHQYAIHITHTSSKNIEYNGPPQEIDTRYTIPPTGGGKPLVIQPQDSIIRRTEQAIHTDQKVTGWLTLGLPLPEDDLRQAGIRYTVSFLDAYDNKYEVKKELK